MKPSLNALIISGTLALLASGCASMQTAYVPQSLGTKGDAIASRGLQLEISPHSEVAVKGEPILFTVELTNVGDNPVMVPRRPNIIFAWTYANGKRDNFLSDAPSEKYLSHHDVMQLAPGGSMQVSVPVKTYYFERLGITEFRAIMESPRNTNPNLGEVWQGSLMSNRYGVMVTKDRQYASRTGDQAVASLR